MFLIPVSFRHFFDGFSIFCKKKRAVARRFFGITDAPHKSEDKSRSIQLFNEKRLGLCPKPHKGTEFP